MIVLNSSHSSRGKLKEVGQDPKELVKHFTAEGKSFSHLFLNSTKNSIALPYKRGIEDGTKIISYTLL